MDATKTRVDDWDHMNHEMEEAISGGSVTTRAISSERVVRMVSLEGRIVAMNAPSGLGRHCVDAGEKKRLALA